MGGDLVLLALGVVAFVFVAVVVVIASISYKLSSPDPTKEFLRQSAASDASALALKAFTTSQQNKTPCPICEDTISVYEDKEALVQPGEPPPLRTACRCGACRGTYRRLKTDGLRAPNQ